MSDTPILRELHKAATPAPWRTYENANNRGTEVLGGQGIVSSIYVDNGFPKTGHAGSAMLETDAALIVALRNAYADGSLVERSELERVERERDKWEATVRLLASTDGWSTILADNRRLDTDVRELVEAVRQLIANRSIDDAGVAAIIPVLEGVRSRQAAQAATEGGGRMRHTYPNCDGCDAYGWCSHDPQDCTPTCQPSPPDIDHDAIARQSARDLDLLLDFSTTYSGAEATLYADAARRQKATIDTLRAENERLDAEGDELERIRNEAVLAYEAELTALREKTRALWEAADPEPLPQDFTDNLAYLRYKVPWVKRKNAVEALRPDMQGGEDG